MGSFGTVALRLFFAAAGADAAAGFADMRVDLEAFTHTELRDVVNH